MSIAFVNSLIKIEKFRLVRLIQLLANNPKLNENVNFKDSIAYQRRKLAILLFDLQTLKSNV